MWPQGRAQWRHLANTIELVLPSAHPSPQPKRQIARFRRFYTCNGETEVSNHPSTQFWARSAAPSPTHRPAPRPFPAKFIRQPTGTERLATSVYHPVKIPSISCRRTSESRRRGPALHPGRHADWPYAATVRTRPRRKGEGQIESERPTT